MHTITGKRETNIVLKTKPIKNKLHLLLLPIVRYLTRRKIFVFFQQLNPGNFSILPRKSTCHVVVAAHKLRSEIPFPHELRPNAKIHNFPSYFIQT
jgi:hypothetical protein